MGPKLWFGSGLGDRGGLPQPAPHTVLCESSFAVSAE